MDIPTALLIACFYIIGLIFGMAIMSMEISKLRKDRIKVTKKGTYTFTPNESGKI